MALEKKIAFDLEHRNSVSKVLLPRLIIKRHNLFNICSGVFCVIQSVVERFREGQRQYKQLRKS